MTKMKSHFLFSIVTVLLISTMSYILSSCSGDGDEKENTTSYLQPFVGYWQYLDEEGEYHSILTITEGGNYQFRYQDGENTGTDGGKVSFDKKINTLTFSPTFNNGTDTKDSDYQYAVYDISSTRLQLVDDDGNSITYEKISDGTFTQHSDWGKSLEGGSWEIYVKTPQGEIIEIRQYTFFEEGIYTLYANDYDYVSFHDGTFKYDKKSITFDGEQADIITLTSNSLMFTMDNYICSGTRTVPKDKQLVKSNKELLIGTWSCVINDYDGDSEESQLTLKPNGEYVNVYNEYDDDVYEGTYYVSEDKIFFYDAAGKDPLGDQFQIEDLNTNKLFLLDDLGGHSLTGTKRN